MTRRRGVWRSAVLLALLAPAMAGCASDDGPPAYVSSSSGSAAPVASAYRAQDFAAGIQEAMAEAGSVRYAVELSDGRRAEGQAETGPSGRRWWLRTTSAEGEVAEYVTVGRSTCVSRSVVRALVRSASGGLRIPRSDRAWNCPPDRRSPFVIVTSNVRAAYDPVGVAAEVDPLQRFEPRGVTDVDGRQLEQVGVATSWKLEFGDAEVWLDDAGLPARLEWTVADGARATATFTGWGEPVDIALPPPAQRSADEVVRTGRQPGSLRPWGVLTAPAS